MRILELKTYCCATSGVFFGICLILLAILIPVPLADAGYNKYFQKAMNKISELFNLKKKFHHMRLIKNSFVTIQT